MQGERSVEALRPGAERLTVEAAAGHLELLEVCESAPFRRDSASELVAADDEHLE